MKVIVVYLYPMNGTEGHFDKAMEFLTTYHACPAEHEHETVIVCNGHPITEEATYLFSSLPGLHMTYHDGTGRDIGAFQFAATHFPCDMMVFFGGNTYIKCTGWLRRMVEAFKKYGDTLYGTTANRGTEGQGVWPHIRTTGFFCSPRLMNAYPERITDSGRHGQRYAFEHGPNSLTQWIVNSGKHPWVVAYDGEYMLPACDTIPNGFHQNDQSNLLVGDRMTRPPYHHCS